MTPAPGPDIGATYRAWAAELDEAEAQLRDALLARLPRVVVDCHTHSSPRAALGTLSEWGWRQARSSFPVWEAADRDATQELMFGDRSVRRVVMGYPFLGFDHRAANRYLLATAAPVDAVVLCGSPDDPAYTTAELARGVYHGLKMYPAYREPPYRRLDEYFPDWSLAAAAAAGVPVVVHTPVPLGECVDDVVAMARRHPELWIVLAHLGRLPEVDAGARAALDRVARCPRVVADTSMATSRAVHAAVLDALGPDRVLYGSDAPFALLRYTAFQHPTDGIRLVGTRRYHWMDPGLVARFGHLAAGVPSVHLQVLDALIREVDARDDAAGLLRRVFHDNAVRVFGLAA